MVFTKRGGSVVSLRTARPRLRDDRKARGQPHARFEPFRQSGLRRCPGRKSFKQHDHVQCLVLDALYLVQALQVSAEAVGLLLLPLAISMVFGGMAGGVLTDRFGAKWPSGVFMFLLCAGLYSMTSLDENSSTLGIVVRLVVLGTARALYRSPNLTAVLSSISMDRLGISGGIYATMRHPGDIFGVALLGSFFNPRLAFHLEGSHGSRLG